MYSFIKIIKLSKSINKVYFKFKLMSTEINQTHQTKSIEDDEDEQKIWILDDFEIGTCLGNGKFGYVYKSIEKKNQKDVAIKVISKKIVEQYDFYEQLKKEIEIHTRLK